MERKRTAIIVKDLSFSPVVTMEASLPVSAPNVVRKNHSVNLDLEKWETVKYAINLGAKTVDNVRVT